MLTDEEIKIIYDEYEREIDAGHTVNGFSRAIERAVLKKLGEQEPAFAFMGGYSMIDGKKYYELTVNYKFKDNLPKGNFYAHPLPAQAIPEGRQLVPIEPTKEMCDAYCEGSIAPVGNLSRYGYKAMLSASPKP